MKKLRPFQREDIEFIKANNHRVLVASSQGTGKTAIAIRALAESYAKCLPALVVCPASVGVNWTREIQAWAPGISFYHVTDTTTPIPFTRDPIFYVISWDLLRVRWHEFRKKIRALVGDEIHLGKEAEALRTQAFLDLGHTVKRILLLSGTPVVNAKEDLDTIYELLGENPPMLRRLLEDVAPDVPPKERAYLHVKLKPKAQARYDEANSNFEDWLRKEKEARLGEGQGEEEVEKALAAEALVKVGYLRRIVGEGKVAAAVEWISRAIRLGEPVVVFAEHQGVIKKLSKKLKAHRIRHGVVNGTTSLKRRQHIIDAFQAHELPVFIGSKAAKEGITLTAARHLLFVERFFTSAEEEQAEDRCIAEGQLVQAERGLIPIEDVKLGERVLTHRGNWKRVLDRHSRTVRARYETTKNRHPTTVTKIDYFRFGEPLVCTYDHKILAVRRPGPDLVPEVYEPEWLAASTLMPGDFVCLPVPSSTSQRVEVDYPEDVRHNALQQTDGHGKVYTNGRYKPMPSKLQLDEETLYLFGWYLAEGWCRVTEGGGNFVGFAAHQKERHILERLGRTLDTWNVSWSIYAPKQGLALSLHAFSTDLVNMLKKWFGTGSHNKLIPTWLMELPPEQLKHLWEGYVQGDGHLKDGHQSWKSVSLALAGQMALIAAKLGMMPTLRNVVSNKEDAWVGSGMREESKACSGALQFADENYVYNPIRSVKSYSNGKLRVWDLTVEDDHSFVVGHAAVHNCRRIGQVHPTKVWFLHATGTVDDRVDAIVRQKRKIVKEAIGSFDIVETPKENVRSLLRIWGQHVEAPEGEAFGHNKELPPLPYNKRVHAVIFRGDRWKAESAKLWCKMQGFMINGYSDLGDRKRVLVRRASLFKPNSFSAIQVAKDIKILVGERVKFENTRRVKASLKHNEG